MCTVTKGARLSSWSLVTIDFITEPKLKTTLGSIINNTTEKYY